MLQRMITAASAALAMLLAVTCAYGQDSVFKTSTQGNPQIKSISAIAFGADGALLVADSEGGQVVVIDTKDTTPTTWSLTEIKDIQGQLAGRIGTNAKGIEIVKIATNPVSKRVYCAIRKLDDKQYLILTVDGDGKISDFPLDRVRYARIMLPADNNAKVKLVTDVTWAKDRILVTAQANDTFASRFFNIPVPVTHEAAGDAYSTETYHVAHKRWETNAPIRTLIPYEEDGKNYVVGAFTCTPIVKYTLDDIKPGARVKGTSVIELGNGNTPRDMFVYEKDGKKYILMSTIRMFHKRQPVGPSQYWTAKVDFDILRENEKVNEQALVRVNRQLESLTDRAIVVPEYHGVMHMDKLDNARAVVIREEQDGGTTLAVLALP